TVARVHGERRFECIRGLLEFGGSEQGLALLLKFYRPRRDLVVGALSRNGHRNSQSGKAHREDRGNKAHQILSTQSDSPSMGGRAARRKSRHSRRAPG